MTDAPSDAAAAKAELRSVMRAARAAVPEPERIRMAALAEEALFELPEIASARTVLLFYAFGSEIPTVTMRERFLEGGARLLLPFLAHGAMEAAEVLPGDALARTTYGPREPASRVAVAPDEVDLVVTPGLAFDRAGRRLGYGGGHYDRFLNRARPEATRVGVGFALQLVDEVPEEPQDQRVHVVVTDLETVVVGKE